MKRERGCGMAGVALPLPQGGRDLHLAQWGELWRWPGRAAPDRACCLPWPLSSAPAKSLASCGSCMARVGCLGDSPGCLPWHGMANFARCSLWRELLPTLVSVKCNPEASWDNHGKVGLRNLAFHYKYSKSLQVWTLWIFLSPFCSFVWVPCKVS